MDTNKDTINSVMAFYKDGEHWLLCRDVCGLAICWVKARDIPETMPPNDQNILAIAKKLLGETITSGHTNTGSLPVQKTWQRILGTPIQVTPYFFMKINNRESDEFDDIDDGEHDEDYTIDDSIKFLGIVTLNQ